MSQFLVDCDTRACTAAPYTAPPTAIDHYALAPTWTLLLVAVLILAFIIAVAIVRFNAHEERGKTERERIRNPPKQCPTCGDKLQTK